eukprot:scaffold27437_cov63-Phaeocystis_antarctica.AAC.2
MPGRCSLTTKALGSTCLGGALVLLAGGPAGPLSWVMMPRPRLERCTRSLRFRSSEALKEDGLLAVAPRDAPLALLLLDHRVCDVAVVRVPARDQRAERLEVHRRQLGAVTEALLALLLLLELRDDHVHLLLRAHHVEGADRAAARARADPDARHRVSAPPARAGAGLVAALAHLAQLARQPRVALALAPREAAVPRLLHLVVGRAQLRRQRRHVQMALAHQQQQLGLRRLAPREVALVHGEVGGGGAGRELLHLVGRQAADVEDGVVRLSSACRCPWCPARPTPPSPPPSGRPARWRGRGVLAPWRASPPRPARAWPPPARGPPPSSRRGSRGRRSDRGSPRGSALAPLAEAGAEAAAAAAAAARTSPPPPPPTPPPAHQSRPGATREPSRQSRPGATQERPLLTSVDPPPRRPPRAPRPRPRARSARSPYGPSARPPPPASGCSSASPRRPSRRPRPRRPARRAWARARGSPPRRPPPPRRAATDCRAHPWGPPP